MTFLAWGASGCWHSATAIWTLVPGTSWSSHYEHRVRTVALNSIRLPYTCLKLSYKHLEASRKIKLLILGRIAGIFRLTWISFSSSPQKYPRLNTYIANPTQSSARSWATRLLHFAHPCLPFHLDRSQCPPPSSSPSLAP